MSRVHKVAGKGQSGAAPGDAQALAMRESNGGEYDWTSFEQWIGLGSNPPSTQEGGG